MNWENQFASVPNTERARTTIELPRKIESQLKALEPKTGVLQTTISILVQKLSDELSKSSITDRHEYQHAVANLVLRLPDTYYTRPGGGDYNERVTATKPPTGNKRNRTVKAAS